MILLSVLAAASAATAPLPPAVELDMRCVAAMAFLVGSSNEDPTKKDQTMALTAGLFYFVGKVDGQYPDADYAAHLKRITRSPDFEKTLAEDIQRCAEEAAQRAEMVGSSADDLED